MDSWALDIKGKPPQQALSTLSLKGNVRTEGSRHAINVEKIERELPIIERKDKTSRGGREQQLSYCHRNSFILLLLVIFIFYWD